MSKKVRRVPVAIDPQGIRDLPEAEIKAILRGADDLIARGGRNLLVKVLKGSQDRKLLELGLDRESPVYGYYRRLTMPEILARVDWMIREGYLAIEYDYRLPLLVFTAKGWEIERETYINELLRGFDALLESGGAQFDMTYLKDRDREMILRLLDRVQASGDRKYIPLLEAWAEVDYKKVRQRIQGVIAVLQG
jgi:hypothetical protein